MEEGGGGYVRVREVVCGVSIVLHGRLLLLLLFFCRLQEVFYTKLPSLEIAILQGRYLKLVWMLTKEIRFLYIFSSFINLLNMYSIH